MILNGITVNKLLSCLADGIRLEESELTALFCELALAIFTLSTFSEPETKQSTKSGSDLISILTSSNFAARPQTTYSSIPTRNAKKRSC